MKTPSIIYQWARTYVATDGGTITWPERLKMAWAEYKRKRRKRCKVKAIATYVTKVTTATPTAERAERAEIRERFRIWGKGAFYQCKPRPQRRKAGKLSNRHVEAALKREHKARTQVYNA